MTSTKIQLVWKMFKGSRVQPEVCDFSSSSPGCEDHQTERNSWEVHHIQAGAVTDRSVLQTNLTTKVATTDQISVDYKHAFALNTMYFVCQLLFQTNI